MEKKISLKTLYLMAIIAIGLVVLGFGSTYALFTASASIDNPIYIVASNLSYTDDIIEAVDVTISPGETKHVVLKINNTSQSSLNYVAWYIDKGVNIDFGSEFNEVAETLGCNTICNNVPINTTGIEVNVYVRNNDVSTITTTIGVSGSPSDVILANNMIMIPNQEMPPPITPLSDFMYVLGSNNTTYNMIDYYDSNSGTVVDGTLVKPITIASNEILLTKYVGESSTVVVPNTYTVGGVTYNTVVLSCGTVRIGDDTTQVRSGVFLGNSYITDVIFKNNVKTLSYDTFSGDVYKSAAYLFENCSSLVNVIDLPDYVNLLYYTFSGCTSLVNGPELPASLTDMTNTFRGCTLLKSVSQFPDTVTSMMNTFSDCSSLETVGTIPASVNTMFMTFSGCSKLTGEINIRATGLSFAFGVFNGTVLPITLKVPVSSTTYNTFNGSSLPGNVTLVEV